jgi:hypothetical protein
LRGAPGARSQPAPPPFFGETQGDPRLRVSIHQNAREITVDANEFIAEPVAAVNASKQCFELVVRNRPLIFLERLPRRRIGQGIAEVIGRERGRAAQGEGEEEEEGEEESRATCSTGSGEAEASPTFTAKRKSSSETG